MSRKQTRTKKDRYRNCHVAVIGTGVLGRQVAIMLAGIGARSMSLYDPRLVLKRHLDGQGFFDVDQGSAKVDATADIAHQYHPQMELLTFQQWITPEHVQRWQSFTATVVFVCVKAPRDRRNIWSLVKDHVQFYSEGSWNENRAQVQSLLLPATRDLSHLQPKIIPPAVVPSRRLVPATLTACLMVNQLLRWQSGLSIVKYQMVEF